MQPDAQRVTQVVEVVPDVFFDCSFAGPRLVEVERDPALEVPRSKDFQDRREVHASGTEILIQIDSVVLFPRRRWPALAAVLSRSVFPMESSDARIVV